MRLLRKLAVFAAAAWLAAACTASFTYNQLDWLIPWYVDDYIDLTRDQRQLLKLQLEPRLQWHREEELARYIDLLDRIEAGLSGPITTDEVNAWLDEFLAAIERVEESMLSVALEFGATVSDAQMAEFMEKLREKQSEYEEEYLSRSDTEYTRDNYENLEELLDRLLGRLSREQDAILRAAAESLRRFDGAWLEERAAWLDTLEPLLRRESGWQQAVAQAYANREINRTDEYRAIVDENTAIITAAVADLLRLMSARQREHARREIEDLRRKLRKLIDRAARG